MEISSDLRELLVILNRYGVEYAVCGGHAVAFYGYPRMTMDMDLLVLPDDENADRLMKALKEFGFGDAGIPRNAFLEEGTAVTLGVQPNQVDIITSMSRASTKGIIARSTPGKLAGVSVRYVCREDLIEAKRQAGRAKDAADLEELGG